MNKMKQKGMDTAMQKKLLEFLNGFITTERKVLFEKVLQFRTRHITVVLEDIYQSHNASAVLRTCDLTGVLDVHIIENRNRYRVNPDVALGSSKWLNLYTHNQQQDNTSSTIRELKKKGYRIVATTPHRESQSLEEIKVDSKIAVLFGTELTGLSETAIEQADEYLRIPMYGFTESYNISVSAALVLFTLTERMRKEKVDWQLSETERFETLLEWTRNSINKVGALERRFLEKAKTED